MKIKLFAALICAVTVGANTGFCLTMVPDDQGCLPVPLPYPHPHPCPYPDSLPRPGPLQEPVPTPIVEPARAFAGRSISFNGTDGGCVPMPIKKGNGGQTGPKIEGDLA